MKPSALSEGAVKLRKVGAMYFECRFRRFDAFWEVAPNSVVDKTASSRILLCPKKRALNRPNALGCKTRAASAEPAASFKRARLLQSCFVRVADVYVSLCQEKTRTLRRALESAQDMQENPPWRRMCASRQGPCFRRTRHPCAVSGWESRHRRLSLCSLPVPKQFEGSLRSRLHRSVGH